MPRTLHSVCSADNGMQTEERPLSTASWGNSDGIECDERSLPLCQDQSCKQTEMNQDEIAIPAHAARKSLGQFLREERLKRGLSQEALAEAIGVSARSIHRWDLDQAIPQEIARNRLCDIFRLDTQSLFGVRSTERASPATSPLWHVPLPRNPFFTGQEELLQALHEKLGSEQSMC